MLEAILERLAAARFELIPVALPKHYVFGRDGYAALVEKTETTPGVPGFGQVGAGGLVTERGLAMLVWRGTEAFFVIHDFEQGATREQVEELRRFQQDLRAALTGERA
jgi:hypothetical protein